MSESQAYRCRSKEKFSQLELNVYTNKMKYLIVSVDTEEDMPNWRPEHPVKTSNVLQLPELQKIFTKCNTTPTYLINQPVVEDEESLAVIRMLSTTQKCEIGAHLHSWNTPPLSMEEKNGQATYLNNHNVDIQYEKLSNFTKLFKEKLGKSPTSYRAGRYGFNHDSADILIDLGYRVDSSIAPLMNYTEIGGPDFSRYSLNPFVFSNKSGKHLLEIPITISLLHRFPPWFNKIYFKIPDWTKVKGVMHRLNLARLLWLRPTTYTTTEMKQLADYVINNDEIPVLNIMFHSSEVCPGTSPYNKTEQDVKNFLCRLEEILSYLILAKDVQSVSMDEFASIYTLSLIHI